MSRDPYLEFETRSAPRYGVGFPDQPNLQGADTAVLAARCNEVSDGFFGPDAGNALQGVPTHVVLFNREAGHGPFVKVFLDDRGRADWTVAFVPVPVAFIDRCKGPDLRIRLQFGGTWAAASGGTMQADATGGRFQYAEAEHYFIMSDGGNEAGA